MAKYIDADNLRKFIEDGLNYKGPDPRKQFGHDAIEILAEIEYAPAADVEPVRHGRWIEKPYLLGTSNFCSECGANYGMPHGKFRFCPDCGTKMDRTEAADG